MKSVYTQFSWTTLYRLVASLKSCVHLQSVHMITFALLPQIPNYCATLTPTRSLV